MTISGVTEVLIAAGLPAELLPPRPDRAKAHVITQPPVEHIALGVAERLRESGLDTEIMPVPDGEHAKTLEVATTVYQALLTREFGRSDTIVGVGGGSVTDLAGYVAGTWLRGVEVVHLPTTYLAAVDAAVGGKTGVNLGGKNLVGVYWHPSRIVIDTVLLDGLPVDLRRQGLAEAYKAGLVGDPALASLIGRDGIEARTDEVVRRSLAVKKDLVDRDPRDVGDRMHLNLGHTIGHAVEYSSASSHGESVSLGLVAAARISQALAGFDDSETVIDALRGLDLPISITGLDRDEVRALVGKDKKRDSAGVRMVLLREIGQPFVTHVDDHAIDIGLAAVGI